MQSNRWADCNKNWPKGSLINSVKPFKSKNRDKIDLDAPNPNLKKEVMIEIFCDSLTYKNYVDL